MQPTGFTEEKVLRILFLLTTDLLLILHIGKVIRLQKAPQNSSQCTTDTSVLSTLECLLWKDTSDLVSSTSTEAVRQLFVLYVMRPFLFSEYVDAGVHVLVSRKFLESVENNVRCQRPVWQVDAAKVNTLCDSALLISDYSVFPHGPLKESPCISVEKKPKCGFIPCSRFVAAGNAIKRCINRFRMHQVLKLHQGEISRISGYDPLDLFSGSSDRIQKAIEAFFTTPQNNFHIFQNGSLIFGDLGGGTYNTKEAFEDSIEDLIQADNGLRTASFLQLVSEAIFRSRVLDRLLEAQKLDLLDIEGAIHAYYNIISQPCKVCRDLGDGELSRIYLSLHSISLEESLKIVKDYLIAATAKD